MMCIQTTLNRIGALSLGASHFTFAMVVAVFVLCIALGSFAVSTLRSIPPALIVGSQWLLVGILALLYFELVNARVLRPRRAEPVHEPSGELLPVSLPRVSRDARRAAASRSGSPARCCRSSSTTCATRWAGWGGLRGRLYAWNTLGSLLGALLGGYALLFFVDLHQVFAIALGALVVGAGILSVLVLRLPVLAVAPGDARRARRLPGPAGLGSRCA